MDKLQAELTKIALELAQDVFEVKLDFSHGSIKMVEAMLAAYHQEYKKTGDDNGLNGIAIEFGAYIVSTIEKNTERGRWERNHPQFGEASFPFYWRNSILFPYEWCRKRIFEGDADNVWIKYQTLILNKIDMSEKKHGILDIFKRKI